MKNSLRDISQSGLYFLLLSVIFIFNLVLVNAQVIPQEIKIGSTLYPMMILVPILIIFLGIVVLIFYLILHSLAISRLNKKENRRKKINKKRLNVHQQNKEKISIEKKKIIKSYVFQVHSLKRNQKKLTVSQSMNKFSLLIRGFFKEFFEIDYEFTFNELEKELEKRKQKTDVIEFVRKLEFQYDQNMSGEQLSKIIVEFEEILNKLSLVGIEKISTILKNEKEEFSELIVNGLDSSFNKKRRKVIRFIQRWENSPVNMHKKIFKKIEDEFMNMTSPERKVFFKKIDEAYKIYNDQICPNTISFENSSDFKKKMDYLKGKFDKKVKTKFDEEIFFMKN